MLVIQSQEPAKNLDKQWVHLMIVARESGFSKEEVREFFRERKFEMPDEATGYED